MCWRWRQASASPDECLLLLNFLKWDLAMARQHPRLPWPRAIEDMMRGAWSGEALTSSGLSQ